MDTKKERERERQRRDSVNRIVVRNRHREIRRNRGGKREEEFEDSGRRQRGIMEDGGEREEKQSSNEIKAIFCPL